MNDVADLPEDTIVLALENRISNLGSIRSIGAGTLTARAWATLCAAVADMAVLRATAADPKKTSATASSLAEFDRHDRPVMRRGAERC